MSISITHIDHIVMTVNNIDETIWFYCDVLGMKEIEYDDERHAVQFGNQKINLHPKTNDISSTAEFPTPGSLDICFISNTPVDEVSSMLLKHGIDVEAGPVKRQGATGKIISVYCRDPDGNLVEISNSRN